MKLGIGALAVVAVLLVLVSTPGSTQSIEEVVVRNFPKVQTVEGKVELSRPVKIAEFRQVTDVLVPPVEPSDTTQLVDAGVLETDGFPAAVLSLHGTIAGTVAKPGQIGAILLPEEETIGTAFRERGLMHFALRVTANDVSSRTPYFASSQPRYTVGFPRYRVYLYNTTDKSVRVNFFAYLTL